MEQGGGDGNMGGGIEGGIGVGESDDDDDGDQERGDQVKLVYAAVGWRPSGAPVVHALGVTVAPPAPPSSIRLPNG